VNEQVQAVELLQSRLRTLGLHLDVLSHEFNQEVETTIKRSKRGQSKPSIELASWAAMRGYKENLRDELRGAIMLGSEHGIELVSCRKLSVALDSGNDPIPFVFDAVVELEQLIEKLLGNDDPWINVKVLDTISRQTTWRHSEDKSRDYIRKGSSDGIYEIRQSRLHEYLTPPMVREYLK
jgi:hypothetical protein